ncbi:hypothetical protein ACVIHD_004104 [Bradyrhizobium embrapense]
MSTYVLVHGAWHTGAEFEPVAAAIRKAGHVVHTPTIKATAPATARIPGLPRPSTRSWIISPSTI